MGETECPAGDDCVCVEEADRGQVETWIAMRAAMGLERTTSGRARTSHGEKINGRGRSGSGGAHGPKPMSMTSGYGSATSLANRLRRKSAPAPFFLPAEEEDDEDGTPPASAAQPGTPSTPARFRVVRSPPEWEDGFEAAISPVPSTGSMATPAKPSPLGPGVSAARVSLGNRLKSLEAQRPGVVTRKRSGGNIAAGNGTAGGSGGGKKAES